MKSFIYPAIATLIFCGIFNFPFQVACVGALAVGACSWISWKLTE